VYCATLELCAAILNEIDLTISQENIIEIDNIFNSQLKNFLNQKDHQSRNALLNKEISVEKNIARYEWSFKPNAAGRKIAQKMIEDLSEVALKHQARGSSVSLSINFTVA
jgi:hypothetical protein